MLKDEESRRPEIVFEGLDEFVRSRIANLSRLLENDIQAAKVELGKHVREIIMRPAPDRSGYVAEGEWDVLADRFPKAHATALPEKCGVGMVPGGGVEPP